MSILEECIDLLLESVGLLTGSLSRLDEATRDVPRLRTVLNTEKVFGLIPETDLEDAKSQLREETHPQIQSIINKVQRELVRLRRRKTNLAGKVDLQQVRLEGAQRNDVPLERFKKATFTEQKLTRLRLLQNKKERLRYSLLRMNLQAKRARLSEHN